MDTRDYRDYPDDYRPARRSASGSGASRQEARGAYEAKERRQGDVSYRPAGSAGRSSYQTNRTRSTGTHYGTDQRATRPSSRPAYRDDGYQRQARPSYERDYAPRSYDHTSTASRQRPTRQPETNRAPLYDDRYDYDDYRPSDDYAPRTARSRATRSSAPRTPNRGNRGGASIVDNPWFQRGILLIALLLVVFLLVNVVSCIGGAIAPQEAQSSSEATATESADASSSSSESASASESTTASQEGVESPWTDNGRFSTGDATLDSYIKKVCDEHSTEGASFDKNAYDTNIYVSQTDYVERENNQSPWGPDWDVEYAKQYFEANNSGNCYNFAAVTQFVLQYFGYSDAEAQPCIVELESGNWGDHGLVFVTNKVDGKRAIVDDALSANGWMLDIDAYNYDVRNIAQNATVKGNTDALDDDDNPMPIAPGELTE